MTHWLLVLTIISGTEASRLPVGEIVDERTCQFAGMAMAAFITEASPGTKVQISCIPGEPV